MQTYIDLDASLKPGYDKLLKGFFIFSTLPLIIMSIGNLSGITNNVFEYFNPRGLNPMVLAFHFSIITIYLLLAYWVYLKNGAAFLSQHPGIIVFNGFGNTQNITSVNSIKLFFAAILLSGFGAMTAMWVLTIPVPVFK